MDNHLVFRISKRSFSYLITSFIVVIAVSGSSEENFSEHTLNAYIKHAVEQNPELVARRHLVESDKQNIATTTKMPDPTLNSSLSLLKDGFWLENVSINQSIPWPGRFKSDRKAAEAVYGASQAMQKDLETDIVFKVRSAYGKIYTMSGMASLQKESLALLKRAEASALSEYSTSMQSSASVLKLQLEIAVVQDRIRQFEVEANIARDELAGLLDTVSTVIPDPTTFPELIVPQKVDEAQQIAMNMNPAVNAAELEVEEMHQKVNSAKAMYIPDLMVGLEYTPPSSMSRVKNPTGFMVMAGVTLPVWPWSRSADVKMSQSMEEYKKKSVEAEKKKLAAEASVFFREYYDAVRQVTLLDSVLLPKAVQTMRVVDDAYRSSRATLMDFIDSQRMLLDLKMQRLEQVERRERMAGEIVICCLAMY